MLDLVVLVLVLALVGFLVHLIVTNVPMPATIQQGIYVVVVIFMVLYLLAMISGGIPTPHLLR